MQFSVKSLDIFFTLDGDEVGRAARVDQAGCGGGVEGERVRRGAREVAVAAETWH